MSTGNRKRSRKRKGSKAPASPTISTRAKVVWAALLGAMTTTGGALYALQGGPSPRLDGVSLLPLVAAAGPSSIEKVFRTAEPLKTGGWQAIVIHHSGSVVGSPAMIADQHRAMGLDGLGHHFVVGNGRGMQDGEISVGYRWINQLPGAHVAGAEGDWYNRHSIGICLVGDGQRRGFTDLQMGRLVELVASLCRELQIPIDRVYLHSDLTQIADPGPLFPEAAFRQRLEAAR